MPKKIIWSETAENDLEQILEYISHYWSHRLAFKFIEKIDHTLLHLVKYPKLHPLIHKDLKVRKCVLTDKNILFYKYDGQTIIILRIFDVRQNPESLKFDIE